MRVVTLLIGLLLLIGPAQADEALRACMRQTASDLHFNGVAYVGRQNDITEETFGTSDRNGEIPVRPSTKFNIGSAGKMFTAVAIGQMMDRGEVSLDAPISTYLKQLPPQIPRITIRQLLSHTSGGDYLKPENHEIIEKAQTAMALLPLAISEAPAFVPGTRFAYSNSGYVVLGAIVEQVSKKTFSDYLQQEIFAPAGMSSTSLNTEGSADPMTQMSPAGPLQKPVLSPLRLAFASPAGGEVSTASDMARFIDALQNGRLVAASTRAKLFTPQPTDAGSTSYGLGFNITAGPPLKVGHGGGAPGINAEIALFPISGWKIITLSNTDPPTATRLATLLEGVIFAADKAAACKVLPNDQASKFAPPVRAGR